jgi:pyruvate formate lyase activating enzyme
MSAIATRYVTRRADGRIQCDVCPRECRLDDGQRGLCFVRKREGDGLVLTTWGRSSGFVIDPIEKKPLAHFYPGSSVLSFGTAGCNLACKFCQNWDITRSRETDTLAAEASPERIARAAVEHGARSVAFTYNDPTIFFEYAIDVAIACHEAGVSTVSVTAGYMHDASRRELYAHVDAANVDLKAFDDDFYRAYTASALEPVKETLCYLVHEAGVWTEVTTLVIPGLNDSDAELAALCEWVAGELGPDVPLHFSAFHPDYKLLDVPPTPLATLRRARELGKRAGLAPRLPRQRARPRGRHHVLPHCGAAVIERDWYEILAYRADERGRCARCNTALDGVFDGPVGCNGRKRLRLCCD